MPYLPIQVKYLLISPAELIQKMLKCERLLEQTDSFLTHFILLFSFYTPWKYQKAIMICKRVIHILQTQR